MLDVKVELLIAAVQVRPPIWRNDHPDHHNSHILSPLWTEVHKAIKEEKKACRDKWKSLVTRMKKELRLVPKARSGDAASSYKSKWKWFESMLFISQYAKERESEGNLDDAIAAHDAELAEIEENKKKSEKKIDEDEHETNVPASLESSSLPIVSQSDGKNVVLPVQDYKENTVMQDMREDESYFETLLGYIRKMSSEQKLQFRKEVLSLIRKHVFPTAEGKKIKESDDEDITVIDWRKNEKPNRVSIKTEPYWPQLKLEPQSTPWFNASTYDRDYHYHSRDSNFDQPDNYRWKVPEQQEPPVLSKRPASQMEFERQNTQKIRGSTYDRDYHATSCYSNSDPIDNYRYKVPIRVESPVLSERPVSRMEFEPQNTQKIHASTYDRDYHANSSDSNVDSIDKYDWQLPSKVEPPALIPERPASQMELESQSPPRIDSSTYNKDFPDDIQTIDLESEDSDIEVIE